MNEEVGYQQLPFRVVCTWCGETIRHSNVKDSRGMCLKCYSRMLSENGYYHKYSERPFKSSER